MSLSHTCSLWQTPLYTCERMRIKEESKVLVSIWKMFNLADLLKRMYDPRGSQIRFSGLCYVHCGLWCFFFSINSYALIFLGFHYILVRKRGAEVIILALKMGLWGPYKLDLLMLSDCCFFEGKGLAIMSNAEQASQRSRDCAADLQGRLRLRGISHQIFFIEDPLLAELCQKRWVELLLWLFHQLLKWASRPSFPHTPPVCPAPIHGHFLCLWAAFDILKFTFSANKIWNSMGR